MRRRFTILTFVLALFAAPLAHAAPASRPVLVVLSGADHITLREGRSHRTGFYMNELLVPLKMLVDAGYTPVFATPGGRTPVLDAHSDSAESFGGDVARYQAMKTFLGGLEALKHPRRLADVAKEGVSRYRAVFVPGGHAPMQDLLVNPDLGKILRQAHALHMPTALICHGPIALISAVSHPDRFTHALERGLPAKAGDWPYAGYRMTVFSTPEEKVAERTLLEGTVLFYPDAALTAAGGRLDAAPPFKTNVVVDRELITGQNPASDDALGKALLKALEASPAP